jgi:predicted metal-dependent hydrolase
LPDSTLSIIRQDAITKQAHTRDMGKMQIRCKADARQMEKPSGWLAGQMSNQSMRSGLHFSMIAARTSLSFSAEHDVLNREQELKQQIAGCFSKHFVSY